MKKIVLITGASSGIGLSCAHAFAADGYSLVLAARRFDILKNSALEIEKKYNIQCLCLDMDVRDQELVNRAINSLPDEWKNISVLVNNAGLAIGMSTIDEGDPHDWDTMIDTNVKGLLYVSAAVIPVMKERKHGHIINIGSIAGREVYPKGNVYCATKHAVDALSKAMRIDLLPYGIRVTQVSPGAVETEFSIVRYKGDSEKARSVYNGYTPLTPDDVAEVVVFCAGRPPHVNINDVLVMPNDQAGSGIFNKNL